MEGGDQGMEDEELGERKAAKLRDPRRPNKEQIAEHELSGHLPMRDWCPHCVRGRGMEAPHRRAEEGAEMPEVSLDFFFISDPGQDHTWTLVAARERGTRMTLATAMPAKGADAFVARRVVAFFREIGCEQGDMVVHSDQEPAIQALITAVGKVRAAAGGGKMIVEASPVGHSASNGVAERAIREVEQQIRTMRSALETRWGVKLDGRHPIFAWMAENAAVLINRFLVGRDGKTAYERSKGKKSKMMGLEFGERVHWKRKVADAGREQRQALGKLDSLWSEGVYLGVKATTGEIIVGDAEGVWRTRTVRRMPWEERWQREGRRW